MLNLNTPPATQTLVVVMNGIHFLTEMDTQVEETVKVGKTIADVVRNINLHGVYASTVEVYDQDYNFLAELEVD